ncbi:unnamed protein product, partial [Larinioides sclopetarius]
MLQLLYLFLCLPPPQQPSPPTALLSDTELLLGFLSEMDFWPPESPRLSSGKLKLGLLKENI